MPDERVINRIHRVKTADAQVIELLREQASQVLTDCARPDTFLGRKTHEPFPQSEDGEANATPEPARLLKQTGDGQASGRRKDG
jgi:hypothetical protein